MEQGKRVNIYVKRSLRERINRAAKADGMKRSAWLARAAESLMQSEPEPK